MAKIIVVEDDAQVAEFIKMILESNHYEIFLAPDGLTVLEKVKELRPDLILLDIMLPGLDGYSIQSNLLGDTETRNIPVVIVTSKPQMEDVFKTATNVAGFVSKPFSTKDLLSAIERALDWQSN